jgi:hypothetical protein
MSALTLADLRAQGEGLRLQALEGMAAQALLMGTHPVR